MFLAPFNTTTQSMDDYTLYTIRYTLYTIRCDRHHHHPATTWTYQDFDMAPFGARSQVGLSLSVCYKSNQPACALH